MNTTPRQALRNALPSLGTQPFSNIRFVIGTGQTKDSITILAGFKSMALTNIRRELAKLFGGYTETSGRGGWYDESRGVLVEESNVIFDVAIIQAPAQVGYTVDHVASAQEVVNLAKRLLQQECVLVQFSYGQSTIV